MLVRCILEESGKPLLIFHLVVEIDFLGLLMLEGMSCYLFVPTQILFWTGLEIFELDCFDLSDDVLPIFIVLLFIMLCL